VHGTKVVSDIFGCTTGTGVDLELVFFGNCIEAWLGICCSEALQELLVGLGKTVVNLIAGCPESI
jgi:hypothetical protein